MTICDFAKSGYSQNGYRKLQMSFLGWIFCDYLQIMRAQKSEQILIFEINKD
jgi:hypothetical protein